MEVLSMFVLVFIVCNMDNIYAETVRQISLFEVFQLASLNSCFPFIFVKTDTIRYFQLANVLWVIVEDNLLRQILRKIEKYHMSCQSFN